MRDEAAGPGPARSWAEQLAAWAVPEEILAATPESPWAFDPDSFEALARSAMSRPDALPTTQRASAALPDGGTVLDVGAGTGAASLPLSRRAGRIIAVDRDPAMLARFAALAEEVGVSHVEVVGDWPQAAAELGRIGATPVDVVVCAHVLYNVADLTAFAAALTAAARHRVVCEISARHPQSVLNPLWQRFHGLTRPGKPDADDAVAVLRAAGHDVRVEPFRADRGGGGATDRARMVASVRRRLCLPADRDAEIDAALDAVLGDQLRLVPQELVTLWWDVADPSGR